MTHMLAGLANGRMVVALEVSFSMGNVRMIADIPRAQGRVQLGFELSISSGRD